MQERRRIEKMLRRNVSSRGIARAIGRSPSGVATEIAVNSVGGRAYNAVIAQLRAETSDSNQHLRMLEKFRELREAVEEALKDGMTLSQISTNSPL